MIRNHRPSQQDKNKKGNHYDVSDHPANTRGVSSSSRASPSSATTSSAHPTSSHKSRTIEDVWNDISLHHDDSHWQSTHPLPHRSLRTMILQDFLAGPLIRPPPAATAFDRPPSAAVPPTALSLEIHLIPPDSIHSSSTSASASASASSSLVFPGFSDTNPPPSPIGLFSFCSKKNLLSDPPSDSGVDRRHKRMMKNRESASRSRARKQVYINELEYEISHLQEENSRLKKELEKLHMAIATDQLFRQKNKLQRSSTASF
ncbi:bZIP transcription factor 27-like [Curcuma longa]|uniref:bZIP transcription factor 27-like n=1 Tax=Curcuma longa TaxID=136217 RepID=UPI003D9FABA4